MIVVTTLAICFVLIGASRKLLPEFVNCEILGFGSGRVRSSKYIYKPTRQREQAKDGISYKEAMLHNLNPSNDKGIASIDD